MRINCNYIVNYLTVILFMLFTGCSKQNETETDFDPAEPVNRLTGTDSEFRLSTGNTWVHV